MRILADENWDGVIVRTLRAEGHDVDHAAEWGAKTDDDALFRVATAERSVFLTHDQGFGYLAERSTDGPAAVVLMRLERVKPMRRAALVAQVLRELGDTIVGRFVVIEPGRVRHHAMRRPEKRE